MPTYEVGHCTEATPRTAKISPRVGLYAVAIVASLYFIPVPRHVPFY